MLDIIFLSYDEPNADRNFKNLVERFPHAKRISNVKGIADAHIAAAKKANTTFFYVVDADAEILDTFNFDYKPTIHEAEYVHIWYAKNPATGDCYGNGGVKLFSKKFFKNVKSQLDFSTTLTKDIKIMEEVACITRFNSDPVRAFRGAFRESVKLFTTANDVSKSELIRKEAADRFELWIHPEVNCDYREFIIEGCKAGVKTAIEHRDTKDLLYINNHDLLMQIFFETFPNIVLAKTETLAEDHPMKHEFFFTTRIASALYDPFVLKNLPVTELRDAISDGQLLSKSWLVEQLANLIESGKVKKNPAIVILGGWIGTLALMINVRELEVEIVSIDFDARANAIAQKLNYDFKFSTVAMDMYDVDYSGFDVIINTSSEHIPNISAWRDLIPADKILIVQNNNYLEGEGHISTVTSSEELKRILKLSEVMYEGTYNFKQYDRYMVIGKT